MERLHIISKDTMSGLAFAQFTLGLTDSQVNIVTSILDIKGVPNGALFVHDDNHPEDSVEISRALSNQGCLNLKDKNYLFEYIGSIYNDIQLVNGMFSAMINHRSTEQGINQIKNKFDYRGLTKLNGFNYTIGRFDRDHQFYFMATDGPMVVILNLYRSYVINKIHPQYKVESINIGKPL